MNWRQLWKRHARWTTNLVASLVGGLLLPAACIEILHVFGIEKQWIPKGKLQDVTEVATFFLVYLLLEESFSHREEIDRFASELGKMTDQTNDLNERSRALSQQIDGFAGITPYSEQAVFDINFRSLVDRFGSVTLVGELPIDYVEEVKQICAKKKSNPRTIKEKRILIYRSLNTASRNDVNEMIQLVSEATADFFKLHHMYGFECISWVMGQNQRDGETEVLLNYAEVDQGSLSGLQLKGKAAESFVRAVTPYFNQFKVPGISYPPIELASREQVEFIVDEKTDYQRKITDMVRFGIPIKGEDGLCRAMIQLLQNTREYLDVTHLCTDEAAILNMRDECFGKWLEANYQAIRRNVRIRRIFIVRRSHYNHPTLRQIMAEMRQRGIDVLVCPLDDLKEPLQADFSIYDGQHLIYTDEAPSNFSLKATLLARRAENGERIRHYKTVFDACCA